MGRYILKRLLLLVPTLFGIILINFVIVQFAPGGPIEQIISQMTLGSMSTTSGISGGGDFGVDTAGASEGNYGLDPLLIAPPRPEEPGSQASREVRTCVLSPSFGSVGPPPHAADHSGLKLGLSRLRQACAAWALR